MAYLPVFTGIELGYPCITHSKFNEVQACLPTLLLCKKCFTWEIRTPGATFINLKEEFALLCVAYLQTSGNRMTNHDLSFSKTTYTKSFMITSHS